MLDNEQIFFTASESIWGNTGCQKGNFQKKLNQKGAKLIPGFSFLFPMPLSSIAQSSTTCFVFYENCNVSLHGRPQKEHILSKIKTIHSKSFFLQWCRVLKNNIAWKQLNKQIMKCYKNIFRGGVIKCLSAVLPVFMAGAPLQST